MVRQILEKMFGGAVIAVFAAVALFARVGDQPRLWDVLSEHFSGSAAAPSGPNVIWVDSQRPVNRMMVTADSAFAPAEAAAPSAVKRAVAAAPAPAKSSWARHLSGVLAFFDIHGPATQTSSASASVASAPAGAAPAPSAPAGAAPASVAAAAPAAGATATAYVNYGSASRSDIMSSASGPTYNFAGSKK